MRKLIAATAILLVYNLTCIAQIKKGSIYLGGDINYFSSNTTEASPGTHIKTWNWGISPALGIVTRENLLAGIKLNFAQGKTERTASLDQTYKGWGAGLFLRKFKRIRQSDFYLFLQGDLSAGFGKEVILENTIDQVKNNSTTYNLVIYPGVNYRLSRKFLLETGLNSLIQLGYSHSRQVIGTTNPMERKSNSFGISSSFSGLSSFYVGVKFLLGK